MSAVVNNFYTEAQNRQVTSFVTSASKKLSQNKLVRKLHVFLLFQETWLKKTYRGFYIFRHFSKTDKMYELDHKMIPVHLILF